MFRMRHTLAYPIYLLCLTIIFLPAPVLFAEDADEHTTESSTSKPTQPPASQSAKQSIVIVATTEEVYSAVRQYTGGAYDAMNSLRRGKSWSNMLYSPERTKSLADTLESGIEQSRPYQGTLRRTLSPKYFDVTPGAVNTDPGFWSWSTSEEWISGNAKSRSQSGRDTVVVTMKLSEKDNYKTIDVASVPQGTTFPQESEQIGQSGTSVRVLSVTQDTEDPRITYVEVEPISPSPRVAVPSTPLSVGARMRSSVRATADSIGVGTATEILVESITGTDIVPVDVSDVVDSAYDASRTNPGAVSQAMTTVRSMAQSAQQSVVNSSRQVISVIRSNPRETAVSSGAASQAVRSGGSRVLVSNSARTLITGASSPVVSLGVQLTVIVGGSGYYVYRSAQSVIDPEHPDSKEWTEYHTKIQTEYEERVDSARTRWEESEGFWESIWTGFIYGASQMENPNSIYP